LIYTDGNDWALYRSGQSEGITVRLAGDVTTAGHEDWLEASRYLNMELFKDHKKL